MALTTMEEETSRVGREGETQVESQRKGQAGWKDKEGMVSAGSV